MLPAGASFPIGIAPTIAIQLSTESTAKLKVSILLWQYVASLEGSMQRKEWFNYETQSREVFLYGKAELQRLDESFVGK